MTSDKRFEHVHVGGGFAITGVTLAGELFSFDHPLFVTHGIRAEIKLVGWGKGLVRYEAWLGDVVCAVSRAVPEPSTT